MPLPAGPHRLGPLDFARWARNPFRLLEHYQRKFGDTFTVILPGIPYPLVVVSHPDVVKGVFSLSADEGHAGKTNAMLEPLLGKHSLLLLDGPEHLRHRKMLQPAFHGDRIERYGHAMLEIANDSIDEFPLGKSFGVHRPMQRIALDVVIRTVLGVESGPRAPALAKTLSDTLDSGASPALLFRFLQHDVGPLSPWGRFRRRFARTSALVHAETARARSPRDAERTDVLAMMADARDDSGNALTNDEIHDELLTLLVAGYETTATALAWTLRWLLPNPRLVTELREEIHGAAGDPLAISQLPLLDSVVKEALRMQPVVALVGRVLPKDTRLGGMDLPAGAVAAPAIHLVHRRRDLYPDPDRFTPDRFLSFKPRPWEWIPFGGGLRRCIGASFALYEMKMVLSAFLTRVDARLATDRIRVVRRGVTIAPSEGMPIIVTERRPRDHAR